MSDPWTPGPWSVDPDNREGMEWNNHIVAAPGIRVCFMANGGSDEAAQARCEANARLIAAAPDLVAMLREVTDAADAVARDNFMWPECELAVRRARALLAKIEGGENV